MYATTRMVIPPTTPATMPAINAMSVSLLEGGLEEGGGGDGESVEGVGAPSSSDGGESGDGGGGSGGGGVGDGGGGNGGGGGGQVPHCGCLNDSPANPELVSKLSGLELILSTHHPERS